MKINSRFCQFITRNIANFAKLFWKKKVLIDNSLIGHIKIAKFVDQAQKNRNFGMTQKMLHILTYHFNKII